MTNTSNMRTQFTTETQNMAVADIQNAGIDAKLEFEVRGKFWEALEESKATLAVSREYEHFILLMGGNGGQPWQSPLPLPHPSGLFWDDKSGELIVSSTRTPNQIFYLKQITEQDYERDVVPANVARNQGALFVPYLSVLLPGTLYIHDVVLMGGELYATITGHNFLAKINKQGGWERAWWPKCVDGMGRASFDQNYLQLNSIAVGGSPETSFYTAFSDETSGAKPWKADYGPRERGVVFSGATRDVLYRGLTCPHAAKLKDGKLWLCNSGYGQTGIIENHDNGKEPTFTPVNTTNGFTRGLAFFGEKYAVVGLSKVIDFYEPYAPGLKPADTVCGLVIFDTETGEEVGALSWPQGYQIYDIQVLPNFTQPTLPHAKQDDGINHALRYLG